VDLGETDEKNIHEDELLEAAYESGRSRWDGYTGLATKVRALNPANLGLSLGMRSELSLGAVKFGGAGNHAVTITYGPFAPWVGSVRALLLAGLALGTVAAILNIVKGSS